jgi:hypothetical protein
MSATQTPYFIWDYDLTEADVREILRGDDEQQKAWLVPMSWDEIKGFYQQLARLLLTRIKPN